MSMFYSKKWIDLISTWTDLCMVYVISNYFPDKFLVSKLYTIDSTASGTLNFKIEKWQNTKKKKPHCCQNILFAQRKKKASFSPKKKKKKQYTIQNTHLKMLIIYYFSIFIECRRRFEGRKARIIIIVVCAFLVFWHVRTLLA